MAVPNTFAAATSAIPLANLDANFAYYDAAYSITGTAISFTGAVTLSTGTANGVPYLNASKVLTSGAVLTFDGTILSSTGFAGPLNGTVGATTANTGAFTTLTTSSTVTLNDGTANGVPYLNGSKVLTSGTALTFDGTTFTLPRLGQSSSGNYGYFNTTGAGNGFLSFQYNGSEIGEIGQGSGIISGGSNTDFGIRATNNLVFGISYNEKMRLTSTGLGIGTSSPSYKLDAQKTSDGIVGYFRRIGATINPAISISANETGNTVGFGTDYAGSVSPAMTFSTQGAERLRIDASGNLGLGTTPSAWFSTWKGFQIGASGSLSSRSDVFGTILSNNAFINSAGNNAYIGTGAAAQYSLIGNEHRWYNAPSGTAGAAISFTQVMTLDASGRLGVGTTSPQQKVHLDSAGATYFRADAAGGNNAGLITFDGGNQAQFYNTGGAWVWTTGGTTERARIDASGNLLVGATSAFSNARLTVSTAATDGVASTQGTAGGYCFVANALSNGGTFYLQAFSANGAGVGSITSNGTNTTYATSSDYRLKNITGPITTSGAYIDSLKPVEGTWKADGSTFVGLIAHETQEVSRTTVATGTKDGDEMQGMDYSSAEIIANLIAEIQDLRKRLAAAGI